MLSGADMGCALYEYFEYGSAAAVYLCPRNIAMLQINADSNVLRSAEKYFDILRFLFFTEVSAAAREGDFMKLIIAEKPSLARNIVNGIESLGGGRLKRRDGWFEGGEYIVTWAFGHLFSLCDVEDYSGQSDSDGKWSMSSIPCFPTEFRFKLRRDASGNVDAGIQKQFDNLCLLCNRDDVDAIVNAGDADREGEIIVRLCIKNALRTAKPQLRLWLPDQTPQTICQALSEMKPEADYENLADEGFARTYIDWLYGVNLTRYATLKTGTLLRVGRVIVPIVKAVYDRDMSIKNFKKDKYYAVVSKTQVDGCTVELVSKRKFTKDELAAAQKLCDEYNAADTVVTAVKRKRETLSAGKLYSLSKLQNFLGKKYKMSMDDSLAAAQKLYENGYLTYPRTNSEYLAVAEKSKIKSIIASVAKLGYPVVFKEGKNIFDDSKIESHSALTPTYKIPDPSALTDIEKKVYSAVVRRFTAVFCKEDCISERTEITVDVGDLETFTVKGSVILQPGWTKYDDYTQKDKLLPRMQKGDKLAVDFRPTEKETAPPKHYTIETLNNYLKNPFREDKAQGASKEGDDEDYRAIFEGLELGTEATRTGIINNARKSKYIELKKDVYHILPAGEFLIESLSRMRISMDKYKTSELGRALKKVYHGQMTVADSVKLAEKEISEVICRKPLPPETDYDDGCYGDVVGKCPLCGREVTRIRFGYGCRGYKDGCKFKVNSYICGRVISESNMKLLLQTGKTSKIQGFVSPRTGKAFDSFLKLEDGKVKFAFDG